MKTSMPPMATGAASRRRRNSDQFWEAVMTRARDPMLRIEWTDPVTGRKGFVVIDRLVGGIAGGGTRVRSGLTLGEVERLARVMTYKCGAMGLASGGAKGGIDCDPHSPEMHGMLTRFVTAMTPLLDSYWTTAEDLGITQTELDEVFREVGLGMSVHAALKRTGDQAAATDRVVRGLAVEVEGIGLADVIGGYGVAEAALAAIEHLGLVARQATAVVQGFGSMGGASARYLQRHGITVVGIIDSQGCMTNSDGLDVEALLAARNELGEVDRTALRESDKQLPLDKWLTIPADIIVPAAVPDSIRADNCDQVTAKLIVEAANISSTEEAQRLLHERGVVIIPDYVANAGANSWWWWTLGGEIGPDADESFAKVRGAMRDTVSRLLRLAAEQQISLREASAIIAEENLDRIADAQNSQRVTIV
jgi:glutamate dehydrogenase (NAD(P)+)